MISFETLVLKDNLPIYQQIVDFIKRGIVAGSIEDGAEMPSRRMLSVLLGVNPNTVQRSYAALEEEGLIRSRAGAKSCLVADEAAIRRLRRELLGHELKTVIDAMQQMGMTLEEAHTALDEYWEVQP